MIKKFFGNKIQEIQEDKKLKEIEARVAKMDIYSMFYYLDEENSCELGIEVILKRLISKEPGVKRRFIEMSDSKFKIEKSFDLIIYILEHNNANHKILRYCENFLFMFSDIINKNDENNKRNYNSKLNNSLFFATKKLEEENNSIHTECKISEKDIYLNR